MVEINNKKYVIISNQENTYIKLLNQLKLLNIQELNQYTNLMNNDTGYSRKRKK